MTNVRTARNAAIRLERSKAQSRARIAVRGRARTARLAIERRDVAVLAALRAGLTYREVSELTHLPVATLHRIAHRT